MQMFDLMFKAKDKPAWDAFAASSNLIYGVLEQNCDVDEIGPIDGLNWHVNLRISDTSEFDPAKLAKGGPGVEWIDPATIEAPVRIWAGGMNYWKP